MHRRVQTEKGLIRALLVIAAQVAALAEEVPAHAASPDFSSDIRPILSDKCFHCHGPDEASLQADLRLDLPATYRGQDATHLFGDGDSQRSELLRRVRSQEDWEQMPPPESNLTLTPDEVSLLEAWIDAGADWSEHWAFVAPRGESPPRARSDWSDHPIDRFVAARHEAAKLTPKHRAEATTLIRRVSLDLTGLPPTPEEVDAFLADQSSVAYERVVDFLLASPRFGERMATDWLDAARYADTYGYQNDRYRRVWPWRDWVVRAINDNLPYDEFLTWQLAGDLLPNATRDQQLATTFNRLHRETNEGGSIPREFRAENVADRVNTLGAAVLGLTLECARCHDHKFDPISQRDYYALSAYFDQTGELGLYSHYTDAVPTPSLDLATADQLRRLAALEKDVADFEEELAKRVSKESDPDGSARPVARYTFDEFDDEQKLVGDPQTTDGVDGDALLLDGENGWTGPRFAFRRSDPFSISVWIKPSVEGQDAVVVHRSRAWLDAAGRGYQLTLDGGRPSAALVHFWPGDSIAVRSHAPLPVGDWSHVAFTYDGSSHADGLHLYVNGEPSPAGVLQDRLRHTIRYAPGDLMPDKSVKLAVGHRFRDKGFVGGAVDTLCVYDKELTPDQVSSSVAGETRQSEMPEPLDNLIERLAQVRLRRDELRDAIPQIAVMADRPDRQTSHVLLRGAYDSPGEAVAPSPPSEIGGDLPPGEPSRLGLARWVTSPDNPLTARVAVNRVWQMLFGRGLVATPEDLGSQGAPPTHPELLDWIARDFVDSGWDLKRLVRLIVTSETYKQSSVAPAEEYLDDPENLLLARGPKGRLSAEALRDSALAASGLLVERIGGPPVHPFQPAGLWEEKGAATYARDRGEGSHRRSLYTVWKRTSPPPSMMTFDASDREVCTMRRQATATPLQALVLLNDPQYVEAACGLADRALEANGLDTQLTLLFRLATSRRPTEAELKVLARLFEEQYEHFKSDPESAATLVAIGDRSKPKSSDAPRTAAMAATALAVLNHDAFVTKR